RVTPRSFRSSAETTEIACGSSAKGTSDLPELTSLPSVRPVTTMVSFSLSAASSIDESTSAAAATVGTRASKLQVNAFTYMVIGHPFAGRITLLRMILKLIVAIDSHLRKGD